MKFAVPKIISGVKFCTEVMAVLKNCALSSAAALIIFFNFRDPNGKILGEIGGQINLKDYNLFIEKKK